MYSDDDFNDDYYDYNVSIVIMIRHTMIFFHHLHFIEHRVSRQVTFIPFDNLSVNLIGFLIIFVRRQKYLI